VVTNPISWRVDLAGPVRQVQKPARRLIAQIAARVRISAGGPAADRLLGGERQELTSAPALEASSFGRESIPLPKPRESAAISEVQRVGELEPETIELQVLLSTPSDFAHNSGR
jgi:hypothetical protein